MWAEKIFFFFEKIIEIISPGWIKSFKTFNLEKGINQASIVLSGLI